MTTIYLRLPVVVDDADPMRCGETCPHHDYVYIIRGHESVVDEDNPAYSVCDWNDPHSQRAEGKQPLRVRHTRCVDATNDAIDAEIDALRRGLSLCEGAQAIGDGPRELSSERERLESRKVKP